MERHSPRVADSEIPALDYAEAFGGGPFTEVKLYKFCAHWLLTQDTEFSVSKLFFRIVWFMRHASHHTASKCIDFVIVYAAPEMYASSYPSMQPHSIGLVFLPFMDTNLFPINFLMNCSERMFTNALRSIGRLGQSLARLPLTVPRYFAARVQQPAPDFVGMAVVNGDFKEIKLKDFAGKYLVLFFYPLDFTFVCPTELIAFSDRIKDFEEAGAAVVGVSTDSHFSHLAWINTPRKVSFQSILIGFSPYATMGFMVNHPSFLFISLT